MRQHLLYTPFFRVPVESSTSTQIWTVQKGKLKLFAEQVLGHHQGTLLPTLCFLWLRSDGHRHKLAQQLSNPRMFIAVGQIASGTPQDTAGVHILA